MEYDNTNSGVLFTNDQGGNLKRPNLRGSLNVGGIDYNVSAWKKESKKDGKPFLSLKIEPKVIAGSTLPKISDTNNVKPADPDNWEDIPF